MEHAITLAQAATQQTSDAVQDSAFAALSASQLALVGGGCGDVLWG